MYALVPQLSTRDLPATSLKTLVGLDCDRRSLSVGSPCLEGPTGFEAARPDATLRVWTDGRLLLSGTSPRRSMAAWAIFWVQFSFPGVAICDYRRGSMNISSCMVSLGIAFAATDENFNLKPNPEQRITAGLSVSLSFLPSRPSSAVHPQSCTYPLRHAVGR